MARQLQDHPFHQNAFPVAECESGLNRAEPGLETGSAKDTRTLARSRRRARILTPPSIRRLWTSPDGHSRSTPETAATVCSQKPARPIALLGLPWTSSRLDVPSRAPPSTGEVESSVQGVGLMGERNSSPPAQLQSALNQSRSEERVNEDATGPHTASDAMCWLPGHLYVHCCLSNRCIYESREDLEPLHNIESQDTFTTAREHQSGYLAWILSVYRRVWPSSVTNEQSPV